MFRKLRTFLKVSLISLLNTRVFAEVEPSILIVPIDVEYTAFIDGTGQSIIVD